MTEDEPREEVEEDATGSDGVAGASEPSEPRPPSDDETEGRGPEEDRPGTDSLGAVSEEGGQDAEDPKAPEEPDEGEVEAEGSSGDTEAGGEERDGSGDERDDSTEGDADDGTGDETDGDTESEDKVEWLEILDEGEIDAWAEAKVDSLTGNHDGSINPDRYAPKRLRSRMAELDGRPEEYRKARNELERRQSSYIGQLERRVEKLDSENGQLNTLLDRKEEEISELQRHDYESLAREVVLEVRDDIRRSLSHDDPESLREAVEMSLNDLEDVLDREGIDVIEPDPGTELNRRRHSPIGTVEDHRPEETVASVERAGLAIGGEVVETARVMLSDGTGTEAEGSGEPPSGADDGADETAEEPAEKATEGTDAGEPESSGADSSDAEEDAHRDDAPVETPAGEARPGEPAGEVDGTSGESGLNSESGSVSEDGPDGENANSSRGEEDPGSTE